MIFRRELRPDARPPSLRFRGPNLHVPLWLLALGWLCVRFWRLTYWLGMHRRWSLALAVLILLLATDTVRWALVVVCALAGAGCLWWSLWPGSFVRWIVRPVQLELREWLVYRRNWQPAMLTAGLTLRESWGGDLPQLRGVRTDAGRDALRVRMLPGQTLEQWQGAAAGLAQTFGARTVRVRRVMNRPQELWLLVTRRGDPSSRHVTEPAGQVDPEQQPATRPAFPRAPRGGAAA